MQYFTTEVSQLFFKSKSQVSSDFAINFLENSVSDLQENFKLEAFSSK